MEINAIKRYFRRSIEKFKQTSDIDSLKNLFTRKSEIWIDALDISLLVILPMNLFIFVTFLFSSSPLLWIEFLLFLGAVSSFIYLLVLLVLYFAFYRRPRKEQHYLTTLFENIPEFDIQEIAFEEVPSLLFGYQGHSYYARTVIHTLPMVRKIQRRKSIIIGTFIQFNNEKEYNEFEESLTQYLSGKDHCGVFAWNQLVMCVYLPIKEATTENIHVVITLIDYLTERFAIKRLSYEEHNAHVLNVVDD